MTTLNRRTFIQFLGGAALSPYLPTLPAAAVSNGASASTSKALWASLYANSASSTEFVSVARTMGLSNSAIQGVGARTIGVRLALAASTEKAAEVGARALQPKDGLSQLRRRIGQSFKQLMDNESSARPGVDRVSSLKQDEEITADEQPETPTTDIDISPNR